MLSYRILHGISQSFSLAVLWAYIGAFLLAMALMFVFPPATILLLWLGLMGLGAVVIVGKLLDVVVRSVARLILRGGACPRCGRRMQSARDPGVSWDCEACAAVFEPDGRERYGDRAAAGLQT
jgi:hypothetical protein